MINPVHAFKTLEAVKTSESDITKLRTATDGFESLFLKSMLKTMRAGMHEGETTKTAGSDLLKEMYDDSLAEAASKGGRLGVAKTLFDNSSQQVLRAALENMNHPAPKKKS